MKKTTLLIIGIILVSSVFAQPGACRDPRMMHKPNKMAMMNKEHRGENREQMMVFRLTEHLELTAEQAEKFFPKMREHRAIMDKIDEEIFETSKVLRDKVKDEKEISDAELKNFLTKVSALQDKKSDARNEFINSLDNVLDNTQIAKLAMAPKLFKNDKMMKKG
ncbi:hypothetical protein KKF86_04675 [bacterium]|nr:hypothetical protein [bacterium]